jgi:hypothetical protein
MKGAGLLILHSAFILMFDASGEYDGGGED